ncbi:MAG: nucleoside phosphorylase [Candidatus Promineifilaceae bacterium]
MSINILPLTGLTIGSVPASVIVCGDPDRATKTADLLEDAALLCENREYRCYTGRFAGKEVAVCSHGIGAPGAAIAFEELIAAGASRLLRVGTCGGLQPEQKSGDLVIVTAAVDSTGYGRETVPVGFPAAADPLLTMSLIRAARQANQTIQFGLALTRDNFYRGVDIAGHLNYQLMSQANVLAVEMECSPLFIVGTLRKAQTAAILVVDGNVLATGQETMDSYKPKEQAVQEGVETALRIALDSLTTDDDTG